MKGIYGRSISSSYLIRCRETQRILIVSFLSEDLRTVGWFLPDQEQTGREIARLLEECFDC